MKNAAPLLILSLLTGCAIRMRYDPKTAASPLPGAEKVTLLVEPVRDKGLGLRMQGGMGQLTFAGSYEKMVEDAIAVELKRMGFQLVNVKNQAKAVFSPVITNTMIEWPGGFHVPYVGHIIMDLAVRSAADVRQILWKGEISGKGTVMGAGGGYAGSKPSRALNEALNDAMGKMRSTLEMEGVVDLIMNGPSAAPALAGAPAAPYQPLAPATVQTAKSDIDELPERAAPNPNAHAIVIGIEKYRERLPNADFAAGDARLMAEYLKRAFGYPESAVAVLVDERAARSDFEKYFERWLPNRVKPGDEVFIYFSGHGSPNPATGDAYLVPYDGDPAYLAETGYPIKKLYEQLAKLPAAKVTVALDSCFSGAGGRSVIASGARPLVTMAPAAALAKNLTVISAAAGDQTSNTYQEKGHGLFTYYFLKGLKAKGGDLRAVYNYLKPEVSKVARESYNADQDPQWRQGQ